MLCHANDVVIRSKKHAFIVHQQFTIRREMKITKLFGKNVNIFCFTYLKNMYLIHNISLDNINSFL
jgi:hypothetical protein